MPKSFCKWYLSRQLFKYSYFAKLISEALTHFDGDDSITFLHQAAADVTTAAEKKEKVGVSFQFQEWMLPFCE